MERDVTPTIALCARFCSTRPASRCSRDVPEPAGTGELVRIRLACGLCGSDVEKLGRPAGTVLGHEVVAETADGRRVVLVHHLPCGQCDRCRAGHETDVRALPRGDDRPRRLRRARARDRDGRVPTTSTT